MEPSFPLNAPLSLYLLQFLSFTIPYTIEYIFVRALFFDRIKGGCGCGCGITTPLNVINYFNQGCVWGNSSYEKLWNHLDNSEKRDFWSTLTLLHFSNPTNFVFKPFMVHYPVVYWGLNVSSNWLVLFSNFKPLTLLF